VPTFVDQPTKPSPEALRAQLAEDAARLKSLEDELFRLRAQECQRAFWIALFESGISNDVVRENALRRVFMVQQNTLLRLRTRAERVAFLRAAVTPAAAAG
jgi:hypothetical protein